MILSRKVTARMTPVLLGMMALAFFAGAFAPRTAYAAALTSTNVEPASLSAGAVGNVTVTFTLATELPADGKIKVTFGAGFDVSTASGGTCSTMDGNFATAVAGQIVTITRSAGSPEPAGAQTCTLSSITNPSAAGTTGTYTIQTTNTGGGEIDIDAAVASDTIIANVLTSTNVQPATLVVSATGTATVTFTNILEVPLDGKIKVTFGSGFDVTAASGGTCSTMDGSFATAVAGQIVTITRSGGSAEPAGAQSCTIANITNPSAAGTTGTYSIQITNSSNDVRDADTAVAADTITAAALTSTNVQPVSTIVGTTNMVTVTFTMANALPSTGKVAVTFGSGFNVSGAASGTCSTMDGSFATSVASQVVTITRSGGASEAAGAQTCTISGIINPVTAGTTGTYTISTQNSSGANINTDAAVAADTMYAASSGSSGTSTTITYDIVVLTPVAAAAYDENDDIAITWSTANGTGSVGAINLDYSVDGGSTWTEIVAGTSNDGSYSWTAPALTEQSVTIRAEATDLVTVLDTDISDAFSIGTEDSTDEDTTDDGTTDDTSDDTLLPEGTFIKGASWSTVYAIGADGTRRPFLDSQTFFTYADNFDGVIDVADDYLANYAIGEPMLPKAGTVLVKIQSVNSVYALMDDATLRWITSESVASAIYGSNWADYVIDVPVTAWGYFNHGEDIDSASDISVSMDDMATRDSLND